MALFTPLIDPNFCIPFSLSIAADVFLAGDSDTANAALDACAIDARLPGMPQHRGELHTRRASRDTTDAQEGRYPRNSTKPDDQVIR